MKILLFAGPSIWGIGRPLPSGVELRAPAQAGDILAAIAGRPDAIALVDGVFGTAPSVWHKEILDALDAGIAVLGAASLGALRAAELHSFGMEGVGAIFAAYAAGEIERDDAVVVAHAPAAFAFRPLSVALVDAEHCIRQAGLPAAARFSLLRIARRMPFPLRTWEAMLAQHPDGAEIGLLLRPHMASLKRADVELLLQRLEQPLHPVSGGGRLVESKYYREMRARVQS